MTTTGSAQTSTMGPDARASGAAPARVQMLEVDGLALLRRVRSDVDPELPIVVLVHGAMDRAASFGRVMRRLPEMETVAYDRRGYANSNHVPEWSPAQTSHAHVGSIAGHGLDLCRVIEFCLADSPLQRSAPSVVVVGHSLGGLIGLWAALREPEVISAVGAYESPAPWLDGSFDGVGGGAIQTALREGNAAGAEHFYRMMVGEETFARLRESDRVARRLEGDALIAELESLRDPRQAFDLGAVHQPVVIGTGEVSAPTMRNNATLMARALDNATTMTISGAAHGAHMSKPDGFADFVRACVDRRAGGVA